MTPAKKLPRLPRVTEDDPDLLLPSFRARVLRLKERMTELGYVPRLFDTGRTPEQARRNALKGTGKERSMHLYGAAADIICGEHLWGCRKNGCPFFTVLGEEGERVGLYWGGRWTTVDLPHLQGLPASNRVQNAMRALGTGEESWAARDRLVSRWLRAVS